MIIVQTKVAIIAIIYANYKSADRNYGKAQITKKWL